MHDLEVIELPQGARQLEIALRGQQLLHEAVGRHEEHGVAALDEARGRRRTSRGSCRRRAGRTPARWSPRRGSRPRRARAVGARAPAASAPSSSVSNVLPGGSFDARRRRVMRRSRRSCASSSKHLEQQRQRRPAVRFDEPRDELARGGREREPREQRRDLIAHRVGLVGRGSCDRSGEERVVDAQVRARDVHRRDRHRRRRDAALDGGIVEGRRADRARP